VNDRSNAGREGADRSGSRRLGRRIGVGIAIVLAIVIAFVVRLVDIQVVSAATYNAEATAKRDGTATVYSTRGSIVDRDGGVLAESVERYDITASPKVMLGPGGGAAILPTLEQIADVTGQEPADLLAVLQEDPESDYAVLATGLDLDQYDRIVALKISGIYGVRVPGRVYPDGQVAGNLVGFLGTDEPLAGIERADDACLAGTDGVVTYQRSADGVRIPGTDVVEQPAVDGGTVTLTIDRDLQWFAQERTQKIMTDLGGTWAASIVVDTTTGEILALADVPTLDPNDFQSADPSVTGSRSFSTPYEPGSIMKPFVMAMLLDQGLITPYDQVNAPYRMDFGPGVGTINDFGYHKSNLTVAGVLMQSSNTGEAQLSEKMPDAQRYDYYTKFGFGQKTDIDFPQSAGVMRPADQWDARTRLNIAFGAGMSATLPQLAQAYLAIANGGLSEPVSLVQSCTAPDGTVTAPERPAAQQVISGQAAATTLSMMEDDQAFYATTDDVSIPGYRIASKTGTAYVADSNGYTNQTTISYAAIAPADHPRYVVITSVGLPYKGNSHLVGAAVRDLLAQALSKNHVAPSTGQYVQYPMYW